MRLKAISYILAAATACMLAGCAGDNEDNNEVPELDSAITVTGISDTKWTYISLENNTVVGTSDKDDTEADSHWSKRTDWDIAICGDMLRTNSGTSGSGQGGIRRLDNKRYEDVQAADAGNVDTDRPQTPDAVRQ